MKCIFDKDFMRKFKITISAVLAALFLILVICSNIKTITICYDGNEKKFVTLRSTVKNLLKSKNISVGQKDKVEPGLDTMLSDKQIIVIKRAVNLQVTTDGMKFNIMSSAEDIDSMLKSEGIYLNTGDKIMPDVNTKLCEGMDIRIIRVETKTVVETVPVSFKENIKNDSKLPNTKKKAIQEGKDGEKQVTYQLTCEDGIEVSRVVINENITKNPVDRVIVQGTYPLMPVSSSGDIMSYTRVFKAKATAYWAVRGVGKTYTASGRKAVRKVDGYSTIAVDPKVIPYGTKLFVEGYGFAIAADTGTAIKGDTVNVFFDTYKEACRWGLKYVNVYILK